MASELDTVKALLRWYQALRKAPPGLPPQETMAWIQRSMSDFAGGDVAYALEHITRSAMLDIVLRFREDGHLKDDKAFEATLRDLGMPLWMQEEARARRERLGDAGPGRFY